MNRLCFAGILILAAGLPTTLTAQNYTARGTVLGGLAGALAGVAIGDHNDAAGAGAAIGAAVGALSGAAIGSTLDAEQARAYAAQQQYQMNLARGVSIHDVVAMTQRGIGDEVIVSHIRENGVQRRLEVSDVIALHEQGVSERVITAMQQGRLAAAAPGRPVRYSAPVYPAPVYAAPVIVEEHHYYGPPVYIRPHYPPRCYAPRPAFGWSFHYSN